MTLGRFAKPILRGAAGVTSFGIAGITYSYFTDDGFRRLVDFNRYVVPIMLHYKYVELRTRGLPPADISATFAPLHEKYAPQALDIVLHMQGFYIKLGQIASTLVTTFPAIWIDVLKVLQEDCPSQPFHKVKAVIESELECSLGELFAEFSQSPIGAASIGQVHTASLRSGENMVVKIQYPEAERNFKIDMDLFIRASRLLAPEFTDPLLQIQRNFVNEFDYTREAALQRRAVEHFQDIPRVVVPRPLDCHHPSCPAKCPKGLCTKKILAMDRLDGVSLQKWCGENIRRMAVDQKITEDELRKRLKALSPAELKSKLPGPWKLRAYLLAARSNVIIRNSGASAYNWTLGWFCPPVNHIGMGRLIDIYEAADAILEAQCHSIFKAGFVNGDPHPGNIMLLKSGQVGLIDWGQVRELSVTERCKIARIFIAVADRDEILTAQYARDLGSRTEKDMDWSYAKKAFVLFGSTIEADELGGLAVFEERMSKIDKRIKLYDNMLAVVTNVIYTRQSVALLGLPELDAAKHYRAAAEACLRLAGQPLPATILGRRVATRPDVRAILGI